MGNKTRLIIYIVLFVSHIWAQNKPGGNSKPSGDQNKSTLDYEFVKNDPLNARIYTLKNGMKVYLSVYKNAPRIQTYIAVKAGSKNDPATATGLAHYLEHMVFKGSDQFGTKNWKKESVQIKKIENLYEVYRKTTDDTQRKNIYHQIDSISGVAAKLSIANEYDKMLAAIGADGTNAFTSFDETVYVNDIPNNQVENWLKIESERFRKLVLRLFHTELEAVYEEKNRNLDSDENKVFETIMSELWKKHTYGTQTTIGTIDHLKNPSMVEIHNYFNKYYVPNNMAIIMSGDFDPDVTIAQIEKHFSTYQQKPVEQYQFEPEKPITSKIQKEVLGPDPANVNIAWRIGGMGTNDEDLATLVTSILSNGNAGLMDLNLNQAQKVLSSAVILWPLKDYSLFGLTAEPKDGQSLEEVEKLLMQQVALLKKGEFPDWLLSAVVTEYKLRKTKSLESNKSRADEMLESFTKGIKWQQDVGRIERLSRISKQEIIDFANKNFNDNNYVVVYKRTGADTTVQKVEKPEITPVDVNRDDVSPFVKKIMDESPPPIEPKFIDYQKDVENALVKSGIQLLYNKNKENKLFELYYKFDMGNNSDKYLPIAVDYIPYVSTKEMTAAQLKEELYKLGCSFDVFSDNENTWVRLTGLNDNFEKSLQLFEKILAEPEVDETVLKNLINDLIKSREDRKLQKGIILNRNMVNYALYGPNNPQTNVLSDYDLRKLSANDIKNKIISLLTYQHKILYYGPQAFDAVKISMENYHRVPAKLLSIPTSIKYDIKPLENTVYVVDYDMKQAEIIMLSNGDIYNPAIVPIVSLYNTYFGGGMSSVVFQDLRESKALAYSTYSRFNLPNKSFKKTFNQSYIGSQADKLADALKGLKDLLDEMPKAENTFNSSKEMLLQDIRTQRIIKSEILFDFLQAQELGHKTDIRKDIFEKVKNYTFDDVKKFQEQNIKGKPTTLLVLGKKEILNLKVLEKYGTVKFLTLKEIFGY